MLDKKFFEKLKKGYVSYEQAYRQLVAQSNDALNRSKRAIFAFHRGEAKAGNELLAEAMKLFTGMKSAIAKEPALQHEGAYRAAVEEFFEANFFGQFLRKEPLRAIESFTDADPELYLGGLSDVSGELVRYAVGQATIGNYAEADRAKAVLDEVIAFLISLDLTGYLRNKYDQAKNSVRRMEEVVYDLSLKKRI